MVTHLPTMQAVDVITSGRTIHADGTETHLRALVRFADGTTSRVNPLTLSDDPVARAKADVLRMLNPITTHGET